MKCKKCESENLMVVEAGQHKKLLCVDCNAFVKFLSFSEYRNFKQIQTANKALHHNTNMDDFAISCPDCGRVIQIRVQVSINLEVER